MIPKGEIIYLTDEEVAQRGPGTRRIYWLHELTHAELFQPVHTQRTELKTARAVGDLVARKRIEFAEYDLTIAAKQLEGLETDLDAYRSELQETAGLGDERTAVRVFAEDGADLADQSWQLATLGLAKIF